MYPASSWLVHYVSKPQMMVVMMMVADGSGIIVIGPNAGLARCTLEDPTRLHSACLSCDRDGIHEDLAYGIGVNVSLVILVLFLWGVTQLIL